MPKTKAMIQTLALRGNFLRAKVSSDKKAHLKSSNLKITK